jgi:hypothetical protein
MSNFGSKITIACLVASVIAAVSVVPISSYAQKQTDFVATLSGKNVVPPVNTPATGTAKFHVNPNGTLSYEVDVNNIKDVIGIPIRLKSGGEEKAAAELLNVYGTVNQKSFTQSLTGQPVSGKISSGVLTLNDIYGPVAGKNISDLLSFFTNKSAYVIVRTTENQKPGEIEGQILPGLSAPATAAAPAAPTAPMNKTSAMNVTAAPTAPMNKTSAMNVTAAPTAPMNKTSAMFPGLGAPTSAAPGMSAPTSAGIVCQHVQIKGKMYLQCPL